MQFTFMADTQNFPLHWKFYRLGSMRIYPPTSNDHSKTEGLEKI